MTLLISWIGVDDKPTGKEIASLYLAADSRYTWGNKGKYDYGIKVFGSITQPEIFGFCGDVVFPSTILGQILPQIDNGILLSDMADPYQKNHVIYKYIETSFMSYPKAFLGGTFTILHATRFEKIFKLFKTSLNQNMILTNEEVNLPEISTKVFSGGSGSLEFENNWRKWENQYHNNYRTSRGVYHCLNETLKKIQDPSTGGYAQIIGLYRNKNARLFGIVEEQKKYIYGKESTDEINLTHIEWRNKNFERVNPENLKKLEGAKRQPS